MAEKLTDIADILKNNTVNNVLTKYTSQFNFEVSGSWQKQNKCFVSDGSVTKPEVSVN